MITQLKEDQILDCRRTLCPVPVIRTKHAMDDLQPGQVLKVIATDPGSWADFPAFSRNTGHELLGAFKNGDKNGDEYVYYLRKARPI